MPSYRTHDRIGTVVSTGIAGVALASAIVDAPLGVTLCAGGISLTTYLSTKYISPDLDTDSKIYTRWKWLRWYWYPYQQIAPHRSWISHSLFFAATFRFFYILPLIIPLILPLIFLMLSPAILIPTQIDVLAQMFALLLAILYVGMLISDFLHIVADMIATYWKKRKKSRNRRMRSRSAQ